MSFSGIGKRKRNPYAGSVSNGDSASARTQASGPPTPTGSQRSTQIQPSQSSHMDDWAYFFPQGMPELIR